MSEIPSRERVRFGEWAWNVAVVAGLSFESCEKLLELGHHLSALDEIDAAILVIILINVLNHAARISDVGHRVNRAGFAAIIAGLMIAATALWYMWHDIVGHVA